MSIGFSGPSSSGKSTLTREIALKSGLPLFAFPTTELMAEIGISGVSDLALPERIAVQTHLLQRFWELSQAHARPFVSDRTPLDMIAYMLAEVSMHNTPDEWIKPIEAFVDKALEITESSFMTIFTVRALPVYEVDPKRPPPNTAYHRHFELLIDGAAARLNHVQVYRILTSKHEHRVGVVLKAMAEVFHDASEERKTRTYS